MAKQQKTTKRSRQNVKLAHNSTSKLRHFRLVHHRHTGKMLHRRHTSYLVLICFLAIVGVFVFAYQHMVQALPSPVSRNVNISAIVPGPPPTIGATITSPADGTQMPYEPTIEVSGTCAADTFVVVSSNDAMVGSTACTSAGIFNLMVQLSPGENILTAKNYDFMDQTGPDTPSVTVTLTVSDNPQPTEPVMLEQPVQPKLPALPYAAPETDEAKGEENKTSQECDDYDPPEVTVGGAPRVSIVCVQRLVEKDTGYILGVLVWGGSPPYALDVDWGDGAAERGLVSLASAGYVKIPFKYVKAGNFTISIKLKDKNGTAAYVETALRVKGETTSIMTGITNSFAHIAWFEAPVPLYLLAVALTLGFWGGDLFERYFRVTKHHRRSHRST